MRAVRPGMGEFAIEAELLHEFRRHGAQAPAYTPIVAAGSHAQCNCNFTISAGAGTINFDGVQQGVKPGDVICLATGLRERINFSNITGTPANPVRITNCVGQAFLGGPTANQAITFTRCRPYHKNDQAFVEQKNGAVVRRIVGYRRLEGVAAAAALARLYATVRLFVNFFQPDEPPA